MSRRPLFVLVCVAGLVGLGAWGWHVNHAPLTSAGQGPRGAQRDQPARVEVAPVVAREVVDDVFAVGTLVSNESVILRPEVAGRIAAIRFDDGARVRRGAMLIELDAAVQLAEVQQAQAELALSAANARRIEDLFVRKFVSSSARDEAASKLEVARATAALAQARLERTRIRAPFDGIVGIRNVSVGDYVKDGEALVNIEDIATLKLDFRLPEAYLSRLHTGQVLELTCDVVSGETFPAVVDAIDPQVDAAGRAVLLRARLANQGGHLRPGVFARVRLIVEQRSAVMLVPEAALMPAPNQVQYVYRVEDGRARRVEVKTGARRASEVEIVAGLAPGDLIVSAGQLKLSDNFPVTVVGADTVVAPVAKSTAAASAVENSVAN
ncbi:MexH family multidrug efflux RND transporter periplasmic adaptor subunit [Betaproteobacteria bacterium]|nr:MexH family multidrug efflux RND transporter periplasmic adaptor subunit [Betaproteobacteria bacterium]